MFKLYNNNYVPTTKKKPLYFNTYKNNTKNIII